MGRVRHKRKNDHVVIVTSDAVDASVKQYRIKPWILQSIILVLCIIIGALIGYFVYEKDIWDAKFKQTMAWKDEADALAFDNKQLEAEVSRLTQEMVSAKEESDGTIADLNEKITKLEDEITYLENVLAQMKSNEETLLEQITAEYLPTHFPLTDSATMREETEGQPICIFSTVVGSMVVATADGTVLAVNADADYEQNVWINHGNGYVTIYRNSGEVKVKQGETVTRGTTLFIIDDKDSELGYQMLKDGVYINPMDVLAING